MSLKMIYTDNEFNKIINEPEENTIKNLAEQNRAIQT